MRAGGPLSLCMAHNPSRERQERLDRQITVLRSIEMGWRAEVWCPGCSQYRAAPYAAIIDAGALRFAWPRVIRSMRCPSCRSKPTMLALHYGGKLVLLLKV